jgi:hypothetical protein
MNQEDQDQIVSQLRKAAEELQFKIQQTHPMARTTPQILVQTIEMNLYTALADIFSSLRTE